MSNVERVRLPYLDGIRGAAALYVVLSHVFVVVHFGSNGAGLPGIVLKGLSFFRFGHYMVDIFIVLSGYVLALPLVLSSGALSGGIIGFFRRRARRILPPFYFALVLAYLIQWITPASPFLKEEVGFRWSPLLSHVFLINSWFEHWKIVFNAPLWSVSAEWQIYLLFPTLLIPIWRRWGVFSMAAVACVIGIGFDKITGGRFSAAHSWYLGLFAFGAVAASIGFDQSSRFELMRRWRGWGMASFLLVVLLGFASTRLSFAVDQYRWLGDSLMGLATLAFLVRTTARAQANRRGDLSRRFLESRPLQYLGRVSYSVYLFHWPLLYAMYPLLMEMELPPVWFLVGLLGFVFPAVVALCAVLSEWVEQPFAGAKRKNTLSSTSASTAAQ